MLKPKHKHRPRCLFVAHHTAAQVRRVRAISAAASRPFAFKQGVKVSLTVRRYPCVLTLNPPPLYHLFLKRGVIVAHGSCKSPFQVVFFNRHPQGFLRFWFPVFVRFLTLDHFSRSLATRPSPQRSRTPLMTRAAVSP